MLTFSTLLPLNALLSTFENGSTALPTTAKAIATVWGRWPSVQSRTRPWRSTSHSIAPGRGALPARSTRPMASGIAVSERNSEQPSVKMMVRPTSPIQVVISVRPPSTSGRKTITEVAVALTTAGRTSRAPSSADLTVPFPSCRSR